MHNDRSEGSSPVSCLPGAKHRYQAPTLQRFGRFSRLTRVGTDPDGDGGIIFGIDDGCNLIPDGDCRAS